MSLISQGTSGNWGISAKFGTPDTDKFVPVSTTDCASFFKDNAWTTEQSGAQKGAYNASGFTAATANSDYYTDSFKVKANQDCGLYLDDDTKILVGGSADDDALRSMRLALKVDGKVFFYQVSSEAIAGVGNSYNTTLQSLNADGVKKAINGEATAGAISAANLSSESVPALSDGVVAAPSNNTELVEKDETKKLCDLTANQEKTVEVYVWMEGCDHDCVVINLLTHQDLLIV